MDIMPVATDIFVRSRQKIVIQLIRRNYISKQSKINYCVFPVPAPSPATDDVCVDSEASSNDAMKRNYWLNTN